MKAAITLFLFVLTGTGSAVFSQTVTIGTQVWMTKNLDVSTFRNGDTIPEIQDVNEWDKAGKEGRPAWCYYNNDPKNGTIYGKLYNWYAVKDPRGLAPSGYHVPTDSEWTLLGDFLGKDAGTKMKSMPIYETKISYVEEGGYDETKWIPCNNCSYWTEKQKANNPCTVCRNQGGKTIKTGKYIPKTKRKVEDKIRIGGWNGTNESGFSGLPGGLRDSSGPFSYRGDEGDWWSASDGSELSAGSAYFRYLDPGQSNLRGDNFDKGYGFSVRCLRD